jgi:tRNA (guanine37-N1)-methyltransferase
MKFEVITIFPDFFRGPLEHGIVRRAREAGIIEIKVHDLRAFTKDRHKTVDDRPFGGGEGMVFKPEPLFECVESLGIAAKDQRDTNRQSVALLSAQGSLFQQPAAEQLSKLERLVLICGRYEGVDERVAEHLADSELCIGDYVLSGGELAAAVVVDAVARLIPGALGHEDSARQESFSGLSRTDKGDAPDSTCGSGGLLDYPHYTRPAEFRGLSVPEPLMNGNHEAIRQWRRRKALEKTLRNRPDLIGRVELSAEDKRLIATIERERNQ